MKSSRRHARLKVDNQSSMVDAQYLPEHIIHQIFLGMPTKPLVRLKCLSMYWNRVISDPNFMKSRSRRMIFLPTLPFHAIDNNNVTGAPSLIKLCSPFDQESFEDITVVGSFNGIVLLAMKYYHMILYNPFSGEYVAVPHSRSFDTHSKYVYGFGYGTTADDLKIVRLRDPHYYCHSISYDVFSLKTWSWSKPIELIGDYCFYGTYSSGTFANGFLYWNATIKRNLLPLIVALDIEKMVFSKMEIPDGCWFDCFGTYNGRLCVLSTQRKVAGWVLKVMNEHGFGKLWSTVCTITSCFQEMCILDDGKLLGKLFMPEASQELVIYNMFKNSYKEVNALTRFKQVGRLQSVEYVESLISPWDICSV